MLKSEWNSLCQDEAVFDFSMLGKHHWTDFAVVAVPVVTWWAARAGSQGSCGIFMNCFFYSQPVITFTTAVLKLTTKRPLQTANTLYMEFIKQWLTLNSQRCILNQAATALTMSARFYVHALCKRPYFFVVHHQMNIFISGRLTACLSSPELTFSPPISPPFCPTSPLAFRTLPPFTPASLFPSLPLSSLCH